jgi:hypothetical protein
MPRDPYIGAGIRSAIPKGSVRDRGRELATDPVSKYRVHHETAAGAGRAGLIKFATTRPYAPSEKAARKLVFVGSVSHITPPVNGTERLLMSLRPTVHGGMAPPASSLATAQEANMKKLFITAALFLATTSAYAGNGCDHDSPRSNYYSSRSNDDSNEQSQSSSYDARRANYNSSRSDYDSPRPRYNSAASNYGSNDESKSSSSSYDSPRSYDNSSSSSNDSPRSNFGSRRQRNAPASGQDQDD